MILHADQKLKQNHKEEDLLVPPKEQFLLRTWTDVESEKYEISK